MTIRRDGGAPRRTALPPPDPEDAAALEVEHHLAEAAERLVASGLAPDEARREAERGFGDPGRYRKRLAREARRRRIVRGWAQAWDLAAESVHGAARTIRRRPGFAAGVVLTLALGVGANAAMFTILDRLFFQPPNHVVDHEGVVRVMVEQTVGGEARRQPLGTFPDFVDLRAHSGFTEIAAWSGPGEETLGRGPDATRIQVTLASHGFFPLLGVRPELGRFYGADEDRVGAPPTAVVGHEFWRRALGSDPEAVGRTVEIAGNPYTVVGVVPPGFTGADRAPVDVWLPMETTRAVMDGSGGMLENRGFWWLRIVARFADGVSAEAASDQATAIVRNARLKAGESDPYFAEARVEFDPLILSRGERISADTKVALWLGGVSVLVLLIAAANVANLLFARQTRRRREVSLRLALGIGRGRLLTQFLLESVLLAILSGATALVLAFLGGEAIRTFLLPGVVLPGPVLGWRAVGFTLLVAALAGGIAAVGPGVQSVRADLASDLAMGAGQASPRRSRVRMLLTVAQAALSVVLLVGSGLFVKSLSEVRGLDLGLDVDRLLLASLEIEGARLGPGSPPPFRAEIHEAAIERLRAVPGVKGVAGTTSPFQWSFAIPLGLPGRDSIPRLPVGGPYFQMVTPGYLETVGLAVRQGRGLAASDGPGDPKVVVVDEITAAGLWPDGDPIGEVLLFGDEEEPLTVVGVTDDASNGGLSESAQIYLPIAQHPGPSLSGLYVRWSGREGDRGDVISGSTEALRTLDPRVQYATVQPLREILDPQTRSWRLGAALFTVFGLLALVVAAIGLYSVLAFDVAQRTREIGIRSALGAESAHLLRAVVASGVGLAAVGVGLGLGVALLAGPYVEELLFQVSPRDPGVLGMVAAAMLGTALLAGLVPALRATRADPMTVLRSE